MRDPKQHRNLMNKTFLNSTLAGVLSVSLSCLVIGCNSKQPAQITSTFTDPIVVEASCGECQFKMPGKGCDLAVRIDGQSYFVDGVNMDQLGDAHAADGFCNAIRKARATGDIKGGRFIAKNFELLPTEKP